MASAVEWPARKPNWKGAKKLRESSSVTRRWWMRCSRVRMRMEVIEMGRKEPAVALLPEPLYSAMTLASLHARGVTECCQEKV